MNHGVSTKVVAGVALAMVVGVVIGLCFFWSKSVSGVVVASTAEGDVRKRGGVEGDAAVVGAQSAGAFSSGNSEASIKQHREQQIQALKEQRYQNGRKYWRERNAFMKTQPELKKWEDLAFSYGDKLAELDKSSEARQLRRWLDGDASTSGKVKQVQEQRREEMGKARRYFLLQTMGELMASPETAGFVKPWLMARMKRMKDESNRQGYNYASASDWSVLADTVFPDPGFLEAWIDNESRESLATKYAADHQLGSVDSSMPVVAEEVLREQIRLEVLRGAASFPVESNLPPHLKEMAEKGSQIGYQLHLLWRDERRGAALR